MNNKITLSLLGGALTAGSAFAGPIAVEPVAVEPGYEASVNVGGHSDYIWRGARLGTDMATSGVDVATEAWGLGLSAGAWYASFDDAATGANTDELDLYAEISKDFGFVTAQTGWIHYNFFGDATDSNEIYVGLSKELCWGLSTSLNYFFTVDSDKLDNDGYTELNIDKSDLFIEGLSLGTQVGYFAEESDFGHITGVLAYDYALSENATISPYIAHTWELDYNAFTIAGYEQNRFHGGVNLTVSF